MQRAMAQALYRARVVYADRAYLPSHGQAETIATHVLVPLRDWDRLVEEVTGNGRR